MCSNNDFKVELFLLLDLDILITSHRTNVNLLTHLVQNVHCHGILKQYSNVRRAIQLN